MINRNRESNDSTPRDPSSNSEASDEDFFSRDRPDEAPDTFEAEDVDIHGKLAHLNALDLRNLTLNKRYVMITLMHPPYSDELGRFMTVAGTYPRLPALSARETKAAIESLKDDDLIHTWEHGGTTCWEIAGAYAFKANLKRQLYRRTEIATQKSEEAGKRRQRKKDADEGIAFVYENDGQGVADNGVLNELMRTKRGNVVPKRPEFFFSSVVPQRKGKPKDQMFVGQPATPKGCILRMLPSFDPAEDLGPLAAVIRFYLLMDCDDYGRVRVDVTQIHGQLGPAITKRVSKGQIKKELDSMCRSMHLILIRKKRELFGYVRDSAQHLLTHKNYNRQIPKLFDDRGFTYDSDAYKAFFEACAKHSAERKTIFVAQFAQCGDIHVVSEYIETAAKRFVEEHDRMMASEPYASMDDFELVDPAANFGGRTMLPAVDQFWYAKEANLPAEWIETLYQWREDELEVSGEASGKEAEILRHLLGMTPGEYVELAKRDEARKWVVPDDDDVPLVVPGDDEIPSVVPGDDEMPLIVPGGDEIPTVVPGDDDGMPPVVPSGDEIPSVVPS